MSKFSIIKPTNAKDFFLLILYSVLAILVIAQSPKPASAEGEKRVGYIMIGDINPSWYSLLLRSTGGIVDPYKDLQPVITAQKQKLIDMGYEVRYIQIATVADVRRALFDPRVKALVWFGHGDPQVPGDISTNAGEDLTPQQIKEWAQEKLKREIGPPSSWIKLSVEERNERRDMWNNAHFDFEYAYFHTCYSLKRNDLPDVLMSDCGQFWGYADLARLKDESKMATNIRNGRRDKTVAKTVHYRYSRSKSSGSSGECFLELFITGTAVRGRLIDTRIGQGNRPWNTDATFSGILTGEWEGGVWLGESDKKNGRITGPWTGQAPQKTKDMDWPGTYATSGKIEIFMSDSSHLRVIMRADVFEYKFPMKGRLCSQGKPSYSTTATPTPAASNVTTPAPSGSNVGSSTSSLEARINISGEFDTEWGKLYLTQSGSTVTGTYPYKSGSIQGILNGKTMVGTWKQNDGSGNLSFTFSADGSRFEGNWSNAKTGEKGGWTGTRKRR